MDPQTGLSRALLLLLFLHLSPLKGCPTLDLSHDDDRSEKEPLSCIPEPQRAPGSLQQGRSSEEAWKAKQAASAGGLGPRDNVPQTPVELQSPKKMPASGCFGERRMNQIKFRGLGCKAAKTGPDHQGSRGPAYRGGNRVTERWSIPTSRPAEDESGD
ncbi:natriuretic peptides B [Glossophaga mutica]